MINHERSHPEYYEELCALAASGQISEPDLVELQDHLQQCEACQSAYVDFIDLLHHKLPLANPEVAGASKAPGFLSESSSYRDRFLARARKQGLGVSRPQGKRRGAIWSWLRLGYPQAATLAAVALLVTVGLIAYSLHLSNARYTKLASDKAAATNGQSIQQSVETHERNVPHESQAAAPPLETPLTTAPVAASSTVTENELAKVSTDRAA